MKNNNAFCNYCLSLLREEIVKSTSDKIPDHGPPVIFKCNYIPVFEVSDTLCNRYICEQNPKYQVRSTQKLILYSFKIYL